MTCNEKFWIDNLSTLFKSDNCGINFVPSMEMSLEQKMNAVTRLVFVIFLVLLLFDVKLSIMFLLSFTTVIIILYYYQKMKSHTSPVNQTMENYVNVPNKPLSAPMFRLKYNNEDMYIKNNKVVVNNPSAYRFCDDEVPLGTNNTSYVSANQRLVGQPNPKTIIPPVMTPPCMDLDYWKANNLVTLSMVNSQSQEDGYQSGFQVSTCCGYLDNEYIDPKPTTKRGHYAKGYRTKQPTQENFELSLKPNIGGVDMACGYNPSQIYESNLPSNLSTGKCDRDSGMSEYNRNLFTQIIEPNIYYKNEINEPTNANMGISFTQQFEPTTCFLDGDSTYITARDPLIIDPIHHDDEDIEGKLSVTTSNVYDPRFSGYGTSYRTYFDRTTGQPRFAYDDVNAIRMPNYITRSNIDHMPFADSYGPLPSGGAYGNEFNAKIKSLANDAFARDTVEYRTGLQQRLMRKVNSQAWQQRVAPIRTGGQYMSGGMSCH